MYRKERKEKIMRKKNEKLKKTNEKSKRKKDKWYRGEKQNKLIQRNKRKN